MLNIDKYVAKGKIRRNLIANDVKKGVLSKEDILDLCSYPQIKESFIETEFKPTIPKSEWTSTYLDEISRAAIAEVFNEDYLLHLFEVSNVIAKKRKRKKILLCIILGLILLLILNGFLFKFVLTAGKVALGIAISVIAIGILIF